MIPHLVSDAISYKKAASDPGMLQLASAAALQFLRMIKSFGVTADCVRSKILLMFFGPGVCAWGLSNGKHHLRIIVASLNPS